MGFSLKSLLPVAGAGLGAMVGGPAGAAIGGTIGSGILGSMSADEAARLQADAANNANSENARQFNITQANQAPWLSAGKLSLAELQRQMGLSGDVNSSGYGNLSKNFTNADFVKDPGYDFRMSEGLKGVENSGAFKGSQLSGATLKALDEYGQGFASNEYSNAYNRFNANQNNQYNRLAGISGTGQTSANTLANVGQNYANTNAELVTGAGNARAAGIVGGANAWNNALGQGVNLYNQSQWMNKLFPQTSYTPSNYNASYTGSNPYNPSME